MPRSAMVVTVRDDPVGLPGVRTVSALELASSEMAGPGEAVPQLGIEVSASWTRPR